MGTAQDVICEECGEHFTISAGGGFTFHQLHCGKCGEETTVDFDELGEVHARYLKGLETPYCVASWDQDKAIQRSHPGEPLGEEAYHEAVEELAGRCDCGGRFSFQALPRCPECRSTRHREDPDGGMILYD
jgi:hypothetical protein